MAARAVEQRINADTADQGWADGSCACGQPGRYAGHRAETFTSVLGLLTLERAYFHCERCATGFCPRDAALGVAGASLSPGVLRMVGLVGAKVSFAEGHELFRALAGVVVPPTHVERAAEALAREIAAEERHVVEAPSADAPGASTLYLGMSAEGRDEEGTPVRDAGSITDSAAIESAARRETDDAASEVAARARREATRRGFDRAPRQVVLGDGAPWIWNVATEHFPTPSRSSTASMPSTTGVYAQIRPASLAHAVNVYEAKALDALAT